jgi:hypothetical protein
MFYKLTLDIVEKMDEIFGTPYKIRAGLEGGEAGEGGESGAGVVTPLGEEEEELEIGERGMGVVCLTISRRGEKGAC